MQQTDGMKPTMAGVVAKRDREASPGAPFAPFAPFAQACTASGLDACVRYDVTITDSLTSSRRKAL